MEAIPLREVADQIDPHADAADDDGSDNAQDEPEREIVTFRGLPGRGVRACIVEIDVLFQERIGFGGDDRNLLGDGFARLMRNPADALTRQLDDFLDAGDVLVPGARPVLVDRALFGEW